MPSRAAIKTSLVVCAFEKVQNASNSPKTPIMGKPLPYSAIKAVGISATPLTLKPCSWA
jgi:hypothetical protein